MAKSTFKIIKFSDILPNPYRDLKGNPLQESKLQELLTSIKRTDYWEGLMVRPHPAKEGKFEIVAGGHHRLEAAKLSGLKEATFNVREGISNEQMLLRMDFENRQVYGNDIRSVIESVRAVVLALAAGDIPAFKIDIEKQGLRKDTLCFAPSFVAGNEITERDSRAVPYTTLLIAQQLDRTCKGGTQANDEVIAAMNALQLIERGQMAEKDLRRSDGSYKSVEAILEMTRELKKRYPVFLENLKEKKQQTEEQKKIIEDSLKQQRKQLVKLDEEKEEIEKQYALAKRAEIAADVKAHKERADENERQRKLQAQKILDDEDRRKNIAKQEVVQRKIEADAQVKEERQKTENWNSLCKTLIDEVNDTFTSSDSLYDRLIRWRENPRVTTAQRSGLALALRNASNRFAEFNPHATSPSAKEQDAMKNLKRNARKKGK